MKRILLVLAMLSALPYSLIGMGVEDADGPDELHAAFGQLDFGRGRMDDPVEARALTAADEEMKRMESEDIGDADAELAADQARDAAEEEARNIEQVRWQNTLLTPSSWLIGLYKRDLVELPKIAGDVGADVLMYRNLLKRRMDAIETQIKSNLPAILKVLNEVKVAQEKADQKYDEMNPVNKILSSKKIMRDRELTPLQQYVWLHHRLVHTNPFTAQTIIPVIGRFIWQKVSDVAIDGILINDAQMPGGMNAFKKNARGEYEVCKEPDIVDPITGEREEGRTRTPFSISNLANMIFNPARTTISRIFSWMHKIDAAPIRSLLGIPEFFYSREMRIAGEFAALGISAQAFDQVNTYYWHEYVIKNKDKLLDILQSYQDALERFSRGADEVVECEQRLRKFIVKGHMPVSWMPGSLLRRWWTAMQQGNITYSRYATYPIMAILAYKAAKVGYAGYKMFYRN